MDMDVAAIHQGFLAGLKARGGQVVCDAAITALERSAGAWHADIGRCAGTGAHRRQCRRRLGRQVAALAGARPVGLVPKRRTAITSICRTARIRAAGRRWMRPAMAATASRRPAASWPRRPMRRRRALRCAAGGSRRRRSSPTGWSAGRTFPCGASRTNGRGCAASSPMRRRWRLRRPGAAASSGCAARAATAS